MFRRLSLCLLLVLGAAAANPATAYDRVVSIGESPFSAESDATGDHGKLVDLVRALDAATHSSSKIVLRPFARSLQETAAGLADVHLPFIEDKGTPPPRGLAYIADVELGRVPFVIYSRKAAPLDASTVGTARTVEVEPDHESFFPFPVHATHCVPCSLDMVRLGRIDALIVSGDIVDPLLHDPKYAVIHRALYKTYAVRALVPAGADSAAIRRYLIGGIKHLVEAGHDHNIPYEDWQP
jgi:hypothetical protein